MAKFSGRIRVLLILTFLSKLTFAVQDALNDPSLEIIRQEDAEEGMDPGYSGKKFSFIYLFMYIIAYHEWFTEVHKNIHVNINLS